MIQIIKGTFGYNDGKRIIPITEKDGPRSFDKELEARLVADGVARYVTDGQKKTNEAVATAVQPRGTEPAGVRKEPETPVGGTAGKQPPEGGGQEADESGKAPWEKPQYSEDMKMSDLRELMTEYDVQFKFGMSKRDIIQALDDYFQSVEDEAPDLTAEDPVL